MIFNLDVDDGGGIIIPTGFAYYNGYLLPELPEVSGYPYIWIRKNDQNDVYDAVYGSDVWYAGSGATLDGWRLQFDNQASVLSRQYTCPQNNPSAWTAATSSGNYYETTNGRKVIWANHDILIGSSTGNVLYKRGYEIA